MFRHTHNPIGSPSIKEKTTKEKADRVAKKLLDFADKSNITVNENSINPRVLDLLSSDRKCSADPLRFSG